MEVEVATEVDGENRESNVLYIVTTIIAVAALVVVVAIVGVANVFAHIAYGHCVLDLINHIEYHHFCTLLTCKPIS